MCVVISLTEQKFLATFISESGLTPPPAYSAHSMNVHLKYSLGVTKK